MAKPGGNKKRCDKYRQQGRREKNKEIKQLRAAAREQKFANRRESGKGYTYKPNPYNPNGTKEERINYIHEQNERAAKNTGKKLPLQHETSIFAKLDRKISQQKSLNKQNVANKPNGKYDVDENDI